MAVNHDWLVGIENGLPEGTSPRLATAFTKLVRLDWLSSRVVISSQYLGFPDCDAAISSQTSPIDFPLFKHSSEFTPLIMSRTRCELMSRGCGKAVRSALSCETCFANATSE